MIHSLLFLLSFHYNNDMYSSFKFDRYELDTNKNNVCFYYILKTNNTIHRFKEKIILPHTLNWFYSDIILHKILQSVHIALGMSYWKLYCSQEIQFSSYSLSQREADFWNIVYTKGFGEFYYQNKINFYDLIHFPSNKSIEDTPNRCTMRDRSLVGIGGGKDSIATSRILQNAGFYINGFVVETQKTYPLINNILDTLKINGVIIKRKIDPKLFELNKQSDIYNGHIPISVIYAFLGVLSAYLYDYTNIIVSNERSSDFGNVKYLNEIINHQWSKSSEFEYLFQRHIRQTITPDIKYFSLLRPFSELQIAQLIANEKEFHQIFSSCNKNFTLSNIVLSNWCGACPKCAFTFILMAAFCNKDSIMNIFGENFLDKPELLPLYKQLFGFEGHKPFECVGTPEEATVAMSMIHDKNEFEDTIVMKNFISCILPNIHNIKKHKQDVFTLKKYSNMPLKFQEIISQI